MSLNPPNLAMSAESQPLGPGGLVSTQFGQRDLLGGASTDPASGLILPCNPQPLMLSGAGSQSSSQLLAPFRAEQAAVATSTQRTLAAKPRRQLKLFEDD